MSVKGRPSRNRNLPAMGMFKTDFYRFFTIGFALGAVLVFVVTVGGNFGNEIAHGVVPAAEAAPAR